MNNSNCSYIDGNNKIYLKIYLFFMTILYKLTLDYTYIKILGNKIDEFPLDINHFKILLSTIIILAIFSLIDQYSFRPSILLFNVFFYITIIPMSVVYGCCDESSLFYATIILGVIVALLIIKFNSKIPVKKRTYLHEVSVVIPWIGVLIIGTLFFTQLYCYGPPSLRVLDFSEVYEIRLHGSSIDNKLFNYIFNWAVTVILPMLLARKLAIKHYIGAMVYVILFIVFYLYSASKAIIFAVPLIIGIFILSKSKNANFWFITLLVNGTLIVSAFALRGSYLLYSYFIRRVMILPAYLKYLYYDFFIMREKIGLAGTLLGSALGKPSPFEQGLGNEISKYYFNNDVMNSNTGFLAEGFYRWGYLGIIFSVILLALILCFADKMAQKSSYSFALAFCIFPIYSLNDTALIDSIIFGPMLIFILILLFYSDVKMLGDEYERKTVFKLSKTCFFSRFNKGSNG